MVVAVFGSELVGVGGPVWSDGDAAEAWDVVVGGTGQVADDVVVGLLGAYAVVAAYPQSTERMSVSAC